MPLGVPDYQTVYPRQNNLDTVIVLWVGWPALPDRHSTLSDQRQYLLANILFSPVSWPLPLAIPMFLGLHTEPTFNFSF